MRVTDAFNTVLRLSWSRVLEHQLRATSIARTPPRRAPQASCSRSCDPPWEGVLLMRVGAGRTMRIGPRASACACAGGFDTRRLARTCECNSGGPAPGSRTRRMERHLTPMCIARLGAERRAAPPRLRTPAGVPCPRRAHLGRVRVYERRSTPRLGRECRTLDRCNLKRGDTTRHVLHAARSRSIPGRRTGAQTLRQRHRRRVRVAHLCTKVAPGTDDRRADGQCTWSSNSEGSASRRFSWKVRLGAVPFGGGRRLCGAWGWMQCFRPACARDERSGRDTGRTPTSAMPRGSTRPPRRRAPSTAWTSWKTMSEGVR